MILHPSVDVLVHRAVRGVPYATFACLQDDFDGGSFPLYTVHGGPYDGSSVTAETLARLGIEVPR